MASTQHTNIYVIRPADGSQPWKIGRSDNVRRRFNELQESSPLRLKVYATLKEHPRVEGWLHRDFHASHSHGEWFNLSDSEKLRLLGYMKRGYTQPYGLMKRCDYLQLVQANNARRT